MAAAISPAGRRPRRSHAMTRSALAANSLSRTRRRARPSRRRTWSTARRRCRACRRPGSCWRTCTGRRRTSRWRARATGRTRSTLIDPSGIASPDSLQTTLSPTPASASMPALQRAYSSSEPDRGQPVCSTTTTSSVERRRAPPAAGLELIGVGHQLEQQAALLQGAEHVVGGERPVEHPHRADAPEPGRGHLPVEQLHGLGHRFRRRDAADDGVGMAVDVGASVERERLLDRVATGRGGDVHQLLDVPPGDFRPGRWARRSGATSP